MIARASGPGLLKALVGALATSFAYAESAERFSVEHVPLEQFQECAVCPEMIVMPLGSFMMGAIPGESRNPFDIYGPLDAKNFKPRVRGPDEINILPHEHPRHRVEMDVLYAMAKTETTQMEWMACVEAGGCSDAKEQYVLAPGGYRELGANHPIVHVSYLDALEYAAWLNDLVGSDVYRLPTEAEWEYAARAGTETRFAQGDDLTADQANFSRAATEHLRGRNISLPELENRRQPVEVGDLDAANAWGVRHMAGNVSEVTKSCWSDKHLELPTDSAYLAHTKNTQPCRRVAKGGAYNNAMDGLRHAARTRPKETYRRGYYGFRVVRELGTAK